MSLQLPLKSLALEGIYKSLQKKYEIKPTAWYLSAEGKKAYESTKTKAERIEYFRAYITAFACEQSEDIKKLLEGTRARLPQEQKNFERNSFAIAYVMANSVDGASLKYGKYPEILSADENPLLKCIKNFPTIMCNATEKEYGTISCYFLEAMRGMSPSVLINEPYGYKALREPNLRDAAYKVERDLLAVFRYDIQKDGGFFPYEIPMNFVSEEEEES